MITSESIKEIATALSKAQGEITPAKMDSVNPFLKNKYADLGSVIQAVKKPMADNGLAFSQHPRIENDKVVLTTRIMHQSGEWMESSIELPMDDKKGLSMAQAMGAVITYLRRYALSSIMGVYADEDTDGNGNGTERKQAQQQAKKPAPPSLVTAAAELGGVAVEHPSAVMTLEMAESETNSKGDRYGDIDTQTLENMRNALQRKFSNGGYASENEAIEKRRKLDAILVILSSRK